MGVKAGRSQTLNYRRDLAGRFGTTIAWCASLCSLSPRVCRFTLKGINSDDLLLCTWIEIELKAAKVQFSGCLPPIQRQTRSEAGQFSFSKFAALYAFKLHHGMLSLVPTFYLCCHQGITKYAGGTTHLFNFYPVCPIRSQGQRAPLLLSTHQQFCEVR